MLQKSFTHIPVLLLGAKTPGIEWAEAERPADTGLVTETRPMSSDPACSLQGQTAHKFQLCCHNRLFTADCEKLSVGMD